MTFGARLEAAVTARGSLCVGIDPHPALLAAWGLADDVDGLSRFVDGFLEAVPATAAVVKPQSAFFEA
jgi:orotidine-5'-phosphate decarboxylase